jgi:hypothetical protein
MLTFGRKQRKPERIIWDGILEDGIEDYKILEDFAVFDVWEEELHFCCKAFTLH